MPGDKWFKRANDTDGRTVENGGLTEDADCEGPRKVIHVGHGKARINNCANTID
jgi:hypothetical protein